MDKLDADLALFRKAFNQRILYFRQLQEISDSVAEVTWDSTLVEAIEGCKREQTDFAAKINTNRARQRYLDHLAKHKDDRTIDEDEETCILCQCEFKRGFITQWCAGVFIVHRLEYSLCVDSVPMYSVKYEEQFMVIDCMLMVKFSLVGMHESLAPEEGRQNLSRLSVCRLASCDTHMSH